MKPDRHALPKYMKSEYDSLVALQRAKGLTKERAEQHAFNVCLRLLGFDPTTGRPLERVIDRWVPMDPDGTDPDPGDIPF